MKNWKYVRLKFCSTPNISEELKRYKIPSTTSTRKMALRTPWSKQHWSYCCRDYKWHCYLSKTMSNLSDKKRDYPARTFDKLWFRHKEPFCENFQWHQRCYRNECDGNGWIARDTLLPHMQTTTLKVMLENGKVLSDTGLVLGCETTSLDLYAYIWAILTTVRSQSFELRNLTW